MKSDVFHIDALAYGGDGVGRGSDGVVCFIPGTLPGETVEAEIIAGKKRFRRGKLLRVLEASPERTVPECPYFTAGDCPGCAYIHCSYSHELEWKIASCTDFWCAKVCWQKKLSCRRLLLRAGSVSVINWCSLA